MFLIIVFAWLLIVGGIIAFLGLITVIATSLDDKESIGYAFKIYGVQGFFAIAFGWIILAVAN